METNTNNEFDFIPIKEENLVFNVSNICERICANLDRSFPTNSNELIAFLRNQFNIEFYPFTEPVPTYHLHKDDSLPQKTAGLIEENKSQTLTPQRPIDEENSFVINKNEVLEFIAATFKSEMHRKMQMNPPSTGIKMPVSFSAILPEFLYTTIFTDYKEHPIDEHTFTLVFAPFRRKDYTCGSYSIATLPVLVSYHPKQKKIKVKFHYTVYNSYSKLMWPKPSRQ